MVLQYPLVVDDFRQMNKLLLSLSHLHATNRSDLTELVRSDSQDVPPRGNGA